MKSEEKPQRCIQTGTTIPMSQRHLNFTGYINRSTAYCGVTDKLTEECDGKRKTRILWNTERRVTLLYVSVISRQSSKKENDSSKSENFKFYRIHEKTNVCRNHCHTDGSEGKRSRKYFQIKLIFTGNF